MALFDLLHRKNNKLRSPPITIPTGTKRRQQRFESRVVVFFVLLVVAALIRYISILFLLFESSSSSSDNDNGMLLRHFNNIAMVKNESSQYDNGIKDYLNSKENHNVDDDDEKDAEEEEIEAEAKVASLDSYEEDEDRKVVEEKKAEEEEELTESFEDDEDEKDAEEEEEEAEAEIEVVVVEVEEEEASTESNEEEKNEKMEDDDEEESDDEVEAEESSTESNEDDEDMYFRDSEAEVADWEYFPSLMHSDSYHNTNNNNSIKSKEKSGKYCDIFMQNIDTNPPPKRIPTNTACDGFEGVLHIRHYDQGGASGTAFFLFTIGMIHWANQHNYLPWIHIDSNYTKPIWDQTVHTTDTEISFTMKTGMEIGWARDRRDNEDHIFPGRPKFRNNTGKKSLFPKQFSAHGTGVWEHYFLPITNFVPGDASCKGKPLVRFDDDHIVPGIHSNAPWAPRAWKYSPAPYILREDLDWDEWFEPQRRHAAETSHKYIRFNPMMELRANCALPDRAFSLGMHIRHGDKYLERDVIEPDVFLQYAEAFVMNGGGSIYLATDSAKVVETVVQDWPKNVALHIVHQPSVLGLTSNDTAAFDIGISSHRTNIEALTDIAALSKCTFFLHSLSAMSEAVLYLNPGLIERSINLEDWKHKKTKRVHYFVNTILPKGRNMQT